MKLRTLMVIKATAAIILAVIMLSIPGPVLTLLGVPDGYGVEIYGRTFGAAVAGIFFLTWFAMNAEDSIARRAIILDLFVYDAVAFLALLIIQLMGAMNALGWIPVALYLFLAVSYGYFLLPQQKAAAYSL